MSGAGGRLPQFSPAQAVGDRRSTGGAASGQAAQRGAGRSPRDRLVAGGSGTRSGRSDANYSSGVNEDGTNQASGIWRNSDQQLPAEPDPVLEGQRWPNRAWLHDGGGSGGGGGGGGGGDRGRSGERQRQAQQDATPDGKQQQQQHQLRRLMLLQQQEDEQRHRLHRDRPWGDEPRRRTSPDGSHRDRLGDAAPLS
ncbi:unnamed protein product, partial [Scytosiphon promiscuus]